MQEVLSVPLNYSQRIRAFLLGLGFLILPIPVIFLLGYLSSFFPQSPASTPQTITVTVFGAMGILAAPCFLLGMGILAEVEFVRVLRAKFDFLGVVSSLLALVTAGYVIVALFLVLVATLRIPD